MEDILLRMQNEFLHEMVLSVPEDENEFDDDHAAIQDNNGDFELNISAGGHFLNIECDIRAQIKAG